MLIYQRLRARNDVNGNPQRVFVVYDVKPGEPARVAKVIDEGFSGKPVELRGMVELAEVNVSSDEYETFISMGRSIGVLE